MKKSHTLIASALVLIVAATVSVVALRPDDRPTDRTGQRTQRRLAPTSIECPAPPGVTGTKAAKSRANNCETAKAIQEMLITSGVTAANVEVSQEETESLLGPELSTNVTATVSLAVDAEHPWDAATVARAISHAVGTTLDRVTILDDKDRVLFDELGRSSIGTAP